MFAWADSIMSAGKADVLPIEHLWKIVFPAESQVTSQLCTIHDCYLDDSKDQKQEIAYVCAGFYGTQDAWQHFTEKWNAQLKAEGIGYWKSSECHSLDGEFRRWRILPPPLSHQAAYQIRDRLQAVALKCPGLHGVGMAVPVKEHEAVQKYEHASEVFPEQFIYHRAFELTLLHSVRAACKGPRDLMVYVHDDGPDFPLLHALFKSYKQKNPLTGSHLTALLPLDDKETPALQLADMFANGLQARSVEFLSGKRDHFSDDEIFMLDRSEVFVWTKELGEDILYMYLKGQGLPIPKDLAEATKSRNP